MAGKVDFHDCVGRKRINIGLRRITKIACTDVNVVYVEQETAASTVREFREEVDFAPVMIFEVKIV